MIFKKLKENLQRQNKKSLEKKIQKRTKHFQLSKYLERAGFSITPHLLSRGLFKFCIAINVIISMYLLLFFVTKEGGYSLEYIIFLFLIIWGLAFFLLLGLIWLAFYFMVDMRIFKRKQDIEDVLPDFLYLAATNIRSGMTIDKALWFAVRPRFGVLAKEIEIVAKEVMSGTELTESLQRFADKYESDILKRSISLLIEGIRSGGEIGELLNRIASNIQESRLMRKEMAANVTSYVIFISFAAVVGAPLLLALANQLIIIISSLMSNIDIPASGSTMFTISNVSISSLDFQIFAYVCLIITSFFSAIIVATIKKGNIKEGIRYIPLFILISIIVFIIASHGLGKFMGSIFL